ncbi:hypothetical protein MNBD_GAMMA11-3457, partial [hydrothermal vent metagenome]
MHEVRLSTRALKVKSLGKIA